MERQFSERQLIRWAVPGWITLFIITILISIHLFFSNELRNSLHCFFANNSFGEIAAIGGAAIAVGFALGFILFQIYFVVYWRFPILGKSIDYYEVVKHINNSEWFKDKFGELEIPNDNKKLKRAERQKLEAYTAAAWWLGISHQEKEKRSGWDSRNQYIVSIYHSIGTILIGTYLTSMGYLIWYICYTCRNIWDFNTDFWPFFINVVILGFWICVLCKSRKDTEFSSRHLMKHALYHFYKQDEEEKHKESHLDLQTL